LGEVRWARGFLEDVFFADPEMLLAVAEQLFSQIPVRALHVFQPEATLTRLAALPQLAQLHTLTMCGISDAAAAQFLKHAQVAQLTKLGITDGQIGEQTLAAIAERCRRLTTLDLDGNPLGNTASLAALPLRTLVELNVSNCGLTDITALMASKLVDSVTKLVLSNNPLGSGVHFRGPSVDIFYAMESELNRPTFDLPVAREIHLRKNFITTISNLDAALRIDLEANSVGDEALREVPLLCAPLTAPSRRSWSCMRSSSASKSMTAFTAKHSLRTIWRWGAQ